MSADMLVKLYDPKVELDLETERKLKEQGIYIKRGLGGNRTAIRAFMTERFGNGWADETDSAVLNGACFIAVKDKQVVGCASYDGLFRGFFGPIGVDESIRGTGIGRVLLLRCLVHMREVGYRYAIIGWTGPQEFYEKCCNAVVIPDSIPHSYRDLISVEE